MNISTSLICCDLSNISKDLDIIVEHEGFNWLHADRRCVFSDASQVDSVAQIHPH